MITDLVLLWTVGIRPVLVHGGGPEINSWLTKLGIQPEFKNGLRVTDGEPASGEIVHLIGARGFRSSSSFACFGWPGRTFFSPPAGPRAGAGPTACRRRPNAHQCLPKPPGPTMEVVEMVLGGRVNKSLVSLIQQAGGKAVGLCGKDGDLLRARQMVEKDIGWARSRTLAAGFWGGWLPGYSKHWFCAA